MALSLSTLSFAAGVAGDLSIIEPPRSGQRVVLRIPPEIPADAPRAAPLLSTASAEAAPTRSVSIRTEITSLIEAVQVAHEAEFDTPRPPTSVLAQQKPRREAGVKPAPEADPAVYETKSA